MSRKKSKHRQAVPAELSAEGSASAVVAEAAPEEVIPEQVVTAAADATPVATPDKPPGRSPRKRRDEASEVSAAAPVESDAAVGDAISSVELHGEAPHGDAEVRSSGHELAMAGDGNEVDRDGEAVEGNPVEGNPVEGDDVVGDPITDEAGVEAALLPGTLSAVQLRHLIEALIFATDKPVTLQRLRQLTRVSDVARIEAALAELHEDYKDRGIALTQVSGGYQFRTNTSFSSWVQQLIAGRPVRLSRAQLETLAIVAYRQPITRPEIDDIRGVDSSATLRLLLDRSLIRGLGKREEVGRPTLFGTTKEFLDFFSLGDLRELPTLREYSELTAESRQVMSDRLGVPLDENGDLVEPETDLLDAEGRVAAASSDDFASGNASIVESILAEHAAAEAAAEGHNAQPTSTSMAEAAMASDHSGDDGDAAVDLISLSADAPFGSARSEARSYIDAIRSGSFVESNAEDGAVADDVDVGLESAGELPEPDDIELRADEAGSSSDLATASVSVETSSLGEPDDLELRADEHAAMHAADAVDRPIDPATELADDAGEAWESDSGSADVAKLDLAHVGEPDDAELAAEAALEAANQASAADADADPDASSDEDDRGN